jgi:hypothetical protein
MKILENKIVCIVLMVVLIAGGFLLGGYKGLAGQYQKAENVFFLGEDGDGICVANDMAERATSLTNMQTVAKKYLPKGDRALESAASSLNDFTQAEGDIRALLAANSGMDAAMAALYQALDEKILSANDEKYRQRLYADFNSRNDTISHDPYYKYAADYNEILMHFPANIIAGLTPAKTAAITR